MIGGRFASSYRIQRNPQREHELGMRRSMATEEEFLMPQAVGHANGIQRIAAGLGAGVIGAGGLDKTDHPGIWQMVTGSTAAGRVFLIGTSTNGFHYGVGGRVRHVHRVMTGAILSTALEEYTIRAGTFSINLPNVIVEGIGFEYAFDQNGGRWQGITYGTGTGSSLDTGVLVVASTWYRLEAECNEDGTRVDFWINDVFVGSLSVVADIPSGTVIDNFINPHIMKLTGTASRAFSIDSYSLTQELER